MFIMDSLIRITWKYVIKENLLYILSVFQELQIEDFTADFFSPVSITWN